ncbi:unnamed protein product [Schistosoma mattheei]|uniref:Uncharacterized protein n=1 Tax=Schistosoma mattheei TaxID=31246 RepID=A0A183PUM9_9TREM|nr:unnamed protein product [Schistosoma mattheei]
MDDVKLQQSLSFHASLPSMNSTDMGITANNNNNNTTTINTTISNSNVDPIHMNHNNNNNKEKNLSTTSTRIQSPCYGNINSSTNSPITTSPVTLDHWSATLLAAQALVRTKKVFIGGVSTGTTADELKTFFSEFGKVSNKICLFI